LKRKVRQKVTSNDRTNAAAACIQARVVRNISQAEMAAIVGSRVDDISNIERISPRAPTWLVRKFVEISARADITEGDIL
jgi:hypothetical protein